MNKNRKEKTKEKKNGRNSLRLLTFVLDREVGRALMSSGNLGFVSKREKINKNLKSNEKYKLLFSKYKILVVFEFSFLLHFHTLFKDKVNYFIIYDISNFSLVNVY